VAGDPDSRDERASEQTRDRAGSRCVAVRRGTARRSIVARGPDTARGHRRDRRGVGRGYWGGAGTSEDTAPAAPPQVGDGLTEATGAAAAETPERDQPGEPPADEQAAAEPSAAAEPVPEEPAAAEPSTAAEPVPEEPAAAEPIAAESVVEAPVAEESAAAEPVQKSRWLPSRRSTKRKKKRQAVYILKVQVIERSRFGRALERRVEGGWVGSDSSARSSSPRGCCGVQQERQAADRKKKLYPGYLMINLALMTTHGSWSAKRRESAISPVGRKRPRWKRTRCSGS